MAIFNAPNAGDKPVPSATTFVVSAILGLIATTLILAFGPEVYTSVPSVQVLEAFAVVTFVLDLMLVTAVVFGFGVAVTGRAMGIAMSGWNDYSLSKLQMALWTIVVLAAVLVFAKIRLLGVFGHVADPLQFTIPGDLLAAMGISAFTAAATPAILALKSSQSATSGEVNAAQQRVADGIGGKAQNTCATGRAVGRVSQESASWLDMVTGDETSNAGIVDLSKVQQLLITILLLGTYISMLIRVLATATKADDLAGLPNLSQYFVGLLAVSHAGYLAYKATPKGAQPASDSTTSPGQASGAGTPSRVVIRLAIDDAQNISGLQANVDLRPIPIGANGFAEVELDVGVMHSIVARGVRAGKAIAGTLTITPTLNDMNKPVELKLL